MIQLVVPGVEEMFLHTCGCDPAGMRARGLFLSYGLKYPFCEYWIQSDEQGACAGITRLDGSVTVCGMPPDMDELCAFLHAVGCRDIFIEATAGKQFDFPIHSEGLVMRLSQLADIQEDLNFNPPLEDVYTILASGEKAITLGEHDIWYADVSHRIRHGTASAVLLSVNEKPAACAMVLAQDHETALLGGVAVLPEYRRRGLGRKVVAGLCYTLQKEQKEVILCCDSSIKNFYEKLGFTAASEWVLLNGNKYR